MRIVGGEARSRQIYLPKKCRIRPTSDKIKETLFNILHDVEGKKFLDLFAGSGNVGIEALSRGATRVVFIEKNVVLAKAIEKNVESLGLGLRCEVLRNEMGRGIRELGERGEKFETLFADPPYETGLIKKTLKNLEDGKLLTSSSIIVVQHSKREALPESMSDHYVLQDQRIYGDTALSFLIIHSNE
ncbi:MAG: 16S rRNA (guanine(966)-N(2))-methyltransferase RsmD [Deltaproteobacteria bacterium]|nr:16S rRNA (guanine(966)-N(2))-methyltransferase RsmD [Deltaproteobacteria bacterium]